MVVSYMPLHKMHMVKPQTQWIVFSILGLQFLFYLLYIKQSNICQKEMGKEVKSRITKSNSNSTEEKEAKRQIKKSPPKTDDCLCNGENFCFKWVNENGSVVYGRKFDCRFYPRLKEAKLLELDARKTINDFDNDEWNPVFLTVVSSNHFNESRPMLESVFKFYPNATVVYYDAGLLENQAQEIRNWPNVEYIRFNFSIYPAHLPNLKTYAFKIAQIEVFQKHKTFYYFDASVRVRAKLDHLEGVKKREIPPIVMYTQAVHSVFAAAHPAMLEYFPVSKEVLYIAELEANTMFFSDSPFTRYAFKWWFLCAMTAECISPMGAEVHCDIGKYNDTYKTYIRCHRFDQAYYNIISLAYLLGETRAALDYQYLDKNWTTLTEFQINIFDRTRMQPISHYARTIEIERWD